MGFRGLGHDEKFVAKMSRVVVLMRAHPKTVLLLTDSADSICKACPHLFRNYCSRNEGAAGRARERDVAVLRRLGLRPGAKMSVESAYRLVRERVTPGIMAREICAGCEWEQLGYCADGLKKLKRT